MAVYSLRARERPTVSTPVSWDEVDRCLKKKDASLLVFESAKVISRFEKIGDLFEPILELKQKLPDVKKMIAAAEAEPVELAAQVEEPATRPARTRPARKSAKKRKV